MSIYIVALTGGIGSGKSTVANAFASLGVSLVDADIIARNIIEKNSLVLNIILQHFGSTILNKNGILDRTALRARIFNNSRDMAWLNNLLHPLIQQQTEQELIYARTPYVLWVVPLLIENNLQKYANRTLVVDVNRECQITRTLNRNHDMNRKQVENILEIQASRWYRLSWADDILDNSGDIKDIGSNVATLHKRYNMFATLALMQKK